MKARVYITLKEGILDPKGKAVEQSLQQLGFEGVKGVRVGKLIEMDLPAMSGQEAQKNLEGMCRKLLANTVIENFKFELKDAQS